MFILYCESITKIPKTYDRKLLLDYLVIKRRFDMHQLNRNKYFFPGIIQVEITSFRENCGQSELQRGE